jgi:uncharacterized LabA/DUF88 family protein
VLVLGDKDYVPTVEAIEEENRKARIVFWDNVAGELTMAASEYVRLEDKIDQISHV